MQLLFLHLGGKSGPSEIVLVWQFASLIVQFARFPFRYLPCVLNRLSLEYDDGMG
jgi:hypothetical protein